jgi:Glycosyl transferases group 1
MKIITLSTYPIDVPQHGGQHRLANIARVFRNAGHVVKSVGVLGSDHYRASPSFVPYPGVSNLAKYIADPFLMEDWAIGELFEKDIACFEALAAQFSDIPDVIHVEHPWLFSFAVKLREKLQRPDIKLIYGSANVENELKYSIVRTYKSQSLAVEAKRRVLDCEERALARADVVCCVSESDLKWSAERTQASLVLAKNGVGELSSSVAGFVEANKISGHRQYALFCASAHPPNCTGFFATFEAGIGCFRPDQVLVIAGAAGPMIQSDPRAQRTAGLQRALIACGTVSDLTLQGLLSAAHAIILPITQGGGTNLKTAEAILAGKHIVATRAAMRGFEEFCEAPGVSVVDDLGMFASRVQEAMSAPPLKLAAAEINRRKVVLWDATLSHYCSFVSGLK